ncbi:hypothetical protein L3X38_018318 [Prunus dulcis]|uniref:Uncharacterized protein n=1 Tax=Prunus dulcis TaxID=3755 RepID=A0AAD4WBC5_PRUDU|nr:hypothetical protein L3X38_018318 [Prunus dulcis]
MAFFYLPINNHLKNPNPNPYPNATLLGPFTQRHSWTLNCVEFDLRLIAHISSLSSSTGAKNDGNQASNDAKVEVEASWIDLYLPRQARPYAKLARLNKPIGTWLLAWPCMW